MENVLESFVIKNLYGQKTINATIKDGILVLVGENGSGKTTFLRIIFYFLSGRWDSLTQFRFEYISATIGGVNYKLEHKLLSIIFKNELFSDVPRSLLRRILFFIKNDELDRAVSEAERVSDRYQVSPEFLIREIDSLDKSGFLDKPRFGSISMEEVKNKECIENFKSEVKNAIQAQILYLPTYRRIERELNSIFEGAQNDYFKRGMSRIRRRENEDENDGSYIELVEFGMKDVQQAIDRTLESLKEFSRENLNNLTLGYLGDVLDRKYEAEPPGVNEHVSESTITSALNRIDENILNKHQKGHVLSVMSAVRSKSELSEHEKIIYHYFMKLLSFQRSLEDKEQQITRFCDLCSDYMGEKKFLYDSQRFSFSINSLKNNGELTIDLSDLSSGEKQIVSLFSHLYLSGQKRFFVLIDEPELSLSVPWQRRFLEDIRSSNMCNGLIAVTHSPFIYDNSLRFHAHSIGEFFRFEGQENA